MQITLEIPDDLAPPLLPPGRNPARVAIELDGFLKEHRIEKYTCEDFEQDVANLE